MQRWFCFVVAAALGCGEVHGDQQDASVPKDGPGGADAPSVIDATTVQAGAAMWLPLDDNPGDGVTDSVGAHIASCTSCPTQVPGRLAGAYAFSNNRVTVAPASDLQPGVAFTLAMWVRVDSAPPPTLGNAIIACKNFGDLDCSYALSVSPNLVPQFYTSSSTSPNLDGTSRLALGTWHHIALTWDGTSKTIFFDGAPSGSGPETSIGSVATGGITLGERQSTSMPLSFNGAVDDLVVFQRVLGAAEITQLANP